MFRHDAQALFHAVVDLPLDERLRHGKVVHFHQLGHNPVLGFLLRFVLALAEDALAEGFAQFLQVAIVAQVLGELVIQVREILAADSLDRGLELNGFASHARGAEILRVGHFEFLFVARGKAAQILGESWERVGATHFEHHFVLADRFALDPSGPPRNRRPGPAWGPH